MFQRSSNKTFEVLLTERDLQDIYTKVYGEEAITKLQLMQSHKQIFELVLDLLVYDQTHKI